MGWFGRIQACQGLPSQITDDGPETFPETRQPRRGLGPPQLGNDVPNAKPIEGGGGLFRARFGHAEASTWRKLTRRYCCVVQQHKYCVRLSEQAEARAKLLVARLHYAGVLTWSE